VTRLTHSGLSIVEWKPLIGALPPLSHADWLELFAKYQQTPEFIKRNHDMTLDGFQFIFWWEWVHRLLGRLIGVVFFLPYLWFLLRGRLRGALAAKVFGFFILGGLQGAMGWYMVKSGLVDDPRVSQYRLAAHLGLAFLIFGLMGWTGLGLLQERSATGALQARRQSTLRLGNTLVALVFVMVLSGALVAGIHAGLAYNSFPLMNGHILPPESFIIDPWYLNFFNNMALVQFDHRLGAWLLAFLVPVVWWKVRGAGAPGRARAGAGLVLVMLVGQVALGIATLVLVVPLPLAAAHQAGAVLLFALALNLVHALRPA